MAIVVGNLLIDPAANSFISLADAVAFLTDEDAPGTPVNLWLMADADAQEASLVTTSRWLAGNMNWCEDDMDEASLLRVARVTTRLAVSAISTNLYSSSDTRGPLARVKADTVEVQWAGAGSSDYQAGGRYWPWLKNELRGLICGSGSRWLLRV